MTQGKLLDGNVKRHRSQATDWTCTYARSDHILSGHCAAVDVFAVHTAAYPWEDGLLIDHKSKDKENIEKSEKMMGKKPTTMVKHFGARCTTS